jgi:hypothetical protein
MLLMLIAAWLLAYAGIFFLGFGGSRWTSDMAINYYKTVLGVAVQIMTMVLLAGIGNDMLSTFYARMNQNVLNFEELGVMLVFCMALLLLVNRVPPMVGGIITGSGIGSAGGIGNFGTGAAIGAVMGAAGMAAGAASVAGSAVMGGAANLAGGGSAIKAAFDKAQASMSSDMPSMGGMSNSSAGGHGTNAGGDGNAGSSPFAQAAGFGGNSESGAKRAVSLAAGTAGNLWSFRPPEDAGDYYLSRYGERIARDADAVTREIPFVDEAYKNGNSMLYDASAELRVRSVIFHGMPWDSFARVAYGFNEIRGYGDVNGDDLFDTSENALGDELSNETEPAGFRYYIGFGTGW